jgi:hypothetical protein
LGHDGNPNQGVKKEKALQIINQQGFLMVGFFNLSRPKIRKSSCYYVLKRLALDASARQLSG